MQRQPQGSLMSSSKSVRIPGTKSLHLYNTLLLIFSVIQLALYVLQGITSQCSQRNYRAINLVSVIFYGFVGVYAYTILVPIILWLCIFWQKGYTLATLYTIGAMLGKVGVVIAVFLTTENHVGYCYVGNDVKVGIAIANSAEALCLAVQLLFIRQAMKIGQLQEVQIFMDAGQQKGYF